MARSLFNMVRALYPFDEEFANYSLKNNTIDYPIFTLIYSIISDIVPISFQMISMRIVIDHYYRKVNASWLIQSSRTNSKVTSRFSSLFKVDGLVSRDTNTISLGYKFKSVDNLEHNNFDSKIKIPLFKWNDDVS